MRALRCALALAVALWLCAAPVLATNPSIANSGSNATGSSYSCPITVISSGSPTNGNIVSVEVGASSSETVQDSNSTSLTQRAGTSGGYAGTDIFDYAVASSPSATYTINASSYCYDPAIIEVSGAHFSASSYCSNGSNGSPCYLAASAGDLLFCYTNSEGGNVSISNASGNTVFFYDSTSNVQAEYATANGGQTYCAGNGSVMADYSAKSLAPRGCGPYPYPCNFRPAMLTPKGVLAWEAAHSYGDPYPNGVTLQPKPEVVAIL